MFPQKMNSLKALQGCMCGLLLTTCLGTLGLPLECRHQLGSTARCTSISQEELLDRLVLHTELIYRVTEEACTLFEKEFIPLPLLSQPSRGGSACTTKAFPIPGSKSETQQISDKWLLHSVLMLVQSWIEPLVYLQTTLDRYDNAPDTLLNKTKWVSEKLPSLEQGVVVLIRKMLDEGMLTSSEQNQTMVHYDLQPEALESILRDYTLLTCFKKDAHKMETFLKLLRCRQANKSGCFAI